MNDENLILGIVAATATIFVLLTGTLGILYTAYRARLRQQSALAAARLSYEQELRTIAAEVSEQTLANLSSELHDNIGGQLTILRIHLETYCLRNPDAAPALQPASDTLTEAVAQVRLLSHSLNAEMLTGAGLRAMVEKEVDRLKALGRAAVHWEADEQEPDLSSDTRLIVFRTFQEAVSNALKHAGAANLFVTLKSAPSFMLSIRDDGRGFSVDAALPPPRGGGILTARKRAAMAGLVYTIESDAGAGTVVTLVAAGTD